MGTITTILCWSGGVVLPPVPELVVQALEKQNRVSIDYWARKTFRHLADELYLGTIKGLTFCKRVIEATSAPVSAEELEAELIKSATPNWRALEVLIQLPEKYRIWLISDYPLAWFQLISSQLNPYPFISPERLIFTADCNLERLVPDIFPLLISKVVQTIEACMLVDGDSSRAVEAVKVGLTAEIFLDAPRLRRSFVLRKMLPEIH